MVGHQISIPETSSYLLFTFNIFGKPMILSPSSTPINSLTVIYDELRMIFFIKNLTFAIFKTFFNFFN